MYFTGQKVSDVMFAADSSPAMAAVREYQLASQELSTGTEEAYDRFQKASARMDTVDGWEAETTANQVKLIVAPYGMVVTR